MKSAIHQYYKKSFEGLTILVQVNPDNLTGIELIVHADGRIARTNRQFDSEIYDDLAVDDFETAGSLEFNLYLKGLVNSDGG